MSRSDHTDMMGAEVWVHFDRLNMFVQEDNRKCKKPKESNLPVGVTRADDGKYKIRIIQHFKTTLPRVGGEPKDFYRCQFCDCTEINAPQLSISPRWIQRKNVAKYGINFDHQPQVIARAGAGTGRKLTQRSSRRAATSSTRNNPRLPTKTKTTTRRRLVIASDDKSDDDDDDNDNDNDNNYINVDESVDESVDDEDYDNEGSRLLRRESTASRSVTHLEVTMSSPSRFDIYKTIDPNWEDIVQAGDSSFMYFEYGIDGVDKARQEVEALYDNNPQISFLPTQGTIDRQGRYFLEIEAKKAKEKRTILLPTLLKLFFNQLMITHALEYSEELLNHQNDGNGNGNGNSATDHLLVQQRHQLFEELYSLSIYSTTNSIVSKFHEQPTKQCDDDNDNDNDNSIYVGSELLVKMLMVTNTSATVAAKLKGYYSQRLLQALKRVEELNAMDQILVYNHELCDVIHQAYISFEDISNCIVKIYHVQEQEQGQRSRQQQHQLQQQNQESQQRHWIDTTT
jgi:hypothetical protein